MSGEHSHPELGDVDASLRADLLAAAEHLARLEASQITTDTVTAALLARVAALEAVRPPTTPPGPTPMRPMRFATVDEARTVLDLPADATYVTWRPEWTNIEQAHAAMGATDILVLPERAAPYVVDSSKGFQVPSNVARVDGVTWPLAKGRGWFSMTRGRRGILGLGPGAVIEVGASAFTQGPQPEEPRNWYDTTGKATVMTGATESVIDFGGSSGRIYVGNLTMRGRDLGGVAYCAVKTPGAVTVERVFFDAAHRGFKGAPNGETGAIATNGTGYIVRHVEVECRDASGRSVATSPLMVNRSGGGLVEDCWFHDATIGMPTLWQCWGEHVWRRVTSERNAVGINLESQGRDKSGVWQGFRLLAEDCAFKAPGGTGMILNLNSPYGSQRINLVRCVIAGARVADTVTVQTWGTPMLQVDSDVTATRPDGTPWPVKFYR